MGAPLYDTAALARRRAIEALAAQAKATTLEGLAAQAKATRGQPVPSGTPTGLQVEAIPPEALRPLVPKPKPRADAAVIRRFIERVRPSGSLLLVAIAPDKGTTEGRSFEMPNQRDAAIEWAVQRNADGANCYWTVNLAPPGMAKKCSKTDILAATAVWADVDPDLKTHGSYEDARKYLLDVELPAIRGAKPTAIVDSGNGIQALWFADKAMRIADKEDIARFEELNKQFGVKFRGPGTYNIDRILRVPGTINYPNAAKLKKGYPAAPTMARLVLADGPKHSWSTPKSTPKSEPTSAPSAPPAPTVVDETLRTRFEKALQFDAKLRSRWEGSTDGLNDKTGSGMDFSMGSMMRVYGFTATEIRELLEPWPHGSPVGRAGNVEADRYWNRIWDRAGTDVEGEPKPTKDVSGVSPNAPRVPQAEHLTTDLANANRILKAYGADIMVVAGAWYVWQGRHWAKDEAEVYRRNCELSKMIAAEARDFEAKAKAAASGEERDSFEAIAKALRKWALKSEMRSVIDAAFGALKKLLAVDASKLDSDPWLLNVANGTIDLRTGELRGHRQSDFITRLVDIEYDPGAQAPIFEQMVAEITNESEYTTRPVAEFLRRWFGYSATGSTREQCFAVHWGAGANGKSTLLEAVACVLGPYAATAAPKLLMATRGDRHPTEIADLFGRRLVTAHESGESDTLNEDLVKQATGSDKMKGRFMRKDFFEFSPTHKLQLLTNHKPQIKGSDVGIWRRILLVPYTVSFGSPEEVAKGERQRLKDAALPEKLLAERQGILAWIVTGAREWYELGLNPPDAVRAASAEYQSEQDRVGQFAAECLDVKADLVDRLTGEVSVYEGYKVWCRECGYMALGRAKFKAALESSVPTVGFDTGTARNQRNIARAVGVRLRLEWARRCNGFGG